MIRARQFADRLLQKFILRPIGYGHPVPKIALDDEYRSGRWDHFDSGREQPRYEALAGLVQELFPAGPDLLDLGCGSGRLAALLASRPLGRYVGVDLSSEGLARARALGLSRMDFIEVDFTSWRPPEKFDLIVFNESIGYARDPAAVALDFSRRLHAGGMIIISQFRFGHYRALWRRILRAGELVRSAEVASPDRQLIWDIRVLRFPSSDKAAR